MQISDEKKVDILVSLLKERYDSAHKLRERSYNFTIWLLGIGVVFIGLVATKQCISLTQKAFISVFVVVIVLLASFFLLSMEKGARKNRRVMIRIEDILGCYQTGFYGGKAALYPTEYMKQTQARSPHFYYLYLWLFTIACCVIGLLWAS